MTQRILKILCVISLICFWFMVIRGLTEKQNKPLLVEFNNMSMISDYQNYEPTKTIAESENVHWWRRKWTGAWPSTLELPADRRLDTACPVTNKRNDRVGDLEL